jgi:hypothetical protein
MMALNGYFAYKCTFIPFSAFGLILTIYMLKVHILVIFAAYNSCYN